MSEQRPLAKFGSIVPTAGHRLMRSGGPAEQITFSVTIEGGSPGAPGAVVNALLDSFAARRGTGCPWRTWPVNLTGILAISLNNALPPWSSSHGQGAAKIQVSLSGGDRTMSRAAMVSELREYLVAAGARPRTLPLLPFEISRDPAVLRAHRPAYSGDVQGQVAFRRSIEPIVAARIGPALERDFAVKAVRFPQAIEELYTRRGALDQMLVEEAVQRSASAITIEVFAPFLRPDGTVDQALADTTVQGMVEADWLEQPRSVASSWNSTPLRDAGLGPKARRLSRADLPDFRFLNA